MKSVKSFVLTAILLFGATVTEAQDKVAAVIKTDIVNNYIWRGRFGQRIAAAYIGCGV